MSVHTIGNGRICAAYDGASVMQAYGPTYSSPNGFTLDAGDGWQVSRLSIGCFSCTRGGVTLTDYADSDGLPILFRRIEGNASMRLRADQPLYSLPESIGKDLFMSECHGGEFMYIYGFENGKPTGYVSAPKRYFGISLRGNLTLTADGAGQAESRDWVLSGEGTIIFAFAECVEKLLEYLKTREKAPAIKPEPAFLNGLTAKQKPYASRVLGVYGTVISQTAESGGVLAGYPYRLCYLRDNYGVYRGLRAIGAHAEADGLARYYIGVYEKYGDIHNAQGPAEFAFHIHENDNVEITAYMCLILCDYLSRRTADGYTDSALGLLNLMLERQHGQLIDGMLPFNGDETYVAGGILPRACLNDGSMEATALYHKSICEAEKIAELYASYRLPDYATDDKRTVEATFRTHFFIDGGWVCNYPKLISPAFRHGVRACGHGFGIAFKNSDGDYVCRECLDKNLAPIWQGGGRRYPIPAAVLCPAFVDSPLISVSERTQAALAVLDNCTNSGRGTGYDLGLVLWALTEPEALEDTAVREAAKSVLEKLLKMPDEFGAYSEYYEDNFTRRSGTLCRPWESCINIAAILRAAENL